MKRTILIFMVIAVIAASLSSCAGRKAKSANFESSTSTSMKGMNDTTRIEINAERIDAVKILFSEAGNYEAVMSKSDYTDFADLLSTAAYDTAWNDTGIMIKMVAPDYTAIISYDEMPADGSDWLMLWKENGRAKFRGKWFFVAEDRRDRLYALLEKYREDNRGIEMSVYPERNGGAPQALELTIKNNTAEVIQFGANYSIEHLEDNKWVEVDLGDFAVIAIMYSIQIGDTGKYTINLFTDRIAYPEGDYRVVKHINIGEQDAQIFYAGFRIIEPR